MSSEGLQQDLIFSRPRCPCECCGVYNKVAKAFKVCNACKVAHYCSMSCQEGDWKEHKTVCARMHGHYMPMKLSRQIIKKLVTVNGRDLIDTHLYYVKQNVHGAHILDIKENQLRGEHVGEEGEELAVFVYHTEQQCIDIRDKTSNPTWDRVIRQIQQKAGMVVSVVCDNFDVDHTKLLLASMICYNVHLY
jgi:ribosomal protein S14